METCTTNSKSKKPKLPKCSHATADSPAVEPDEMQHRQWCLRRQTWFVLRNEKGEVIAAKTCRCLSAINALEAEAISCRTALQWLLRNNFQNVCIETGSLMLAFVVKNSTLYRSSVRIIIQDCICLIERLTNCHLEFGRRTTNKAAHLLAKSAGFSMTNTNRGIATPMQFQNYCLCIGWIKAGFISQKNKKENIKYIFVNINLKIKNIYIDL